MSKRKNLIDKLTVAVDALKNNTIHYDWKEQSSCNAGLVAQAMLGLGRSELTKERQSIFKILEDVNKDRREREQSAYSLTWKNAIKWSCPITGESGHRIIDRLEKAGLSRKDIVHLEYLENPAILKESGIEQEKRVDLIKIGEDVRIEEVQDTSFFGKLFNRTIQKRIVTPQWEERITYSYPEEYYTKKKNLIKYLSAWIRLLQSEGDTEATDRVGLEAELLRAVADENFERAAELRNQLAVL